MASPRSRPSLYGQACTTRRSRSLTDVNCLVSGEPDIAARMGFRSTSTVPSAKTASSSNHCILNRRSPNRPPTLSSRFPTQFPPRPASRASRSNQSLGQKSHQFRWSRQPSADLRQAVGIVHPPGDVGIGRLLGDFHVSPGSGADRAGTTAGRPQQGTADPPGRADCGCSDPGGKTSRKPDHIAVNRGHVSHPQREARPPPAARRNVKP